MDMVLFGTTTRSFFRDGLDFTMHLPNEIYDEVRVWFLSFARYALVYQSILPLLSNRQPFLTY